MDNTVLSPVEPVAWAKQDVSSGRILGVTEDPAMRDYWIAKHEQDSPWILVRVIPLYPAPPKVSKCSKARGMSPADLAPVGGDAAYLRDVAEEIEGLGEYALGAARLRAIADRLDGGLGTLGSGKGGA